MGGDGQFTIFVTLHRAGAVIRSAEITNHRADSGAAWDALPVGGYELHIQARGYGTTIKRVAVAKNEVTPLTISGVGKTDELWGAGPTIAELEKRIAGLEKENTALKERVATLEKR